MPFFDTADGGRLYYEIHGFDKSAPTVVFLNGTTQTTRHWAPQARRFAEQFRVLLYDARTQGRQSRLGRDPLTLDRHTEDLKALMEHLKIESADLVGLSHGAQVALACAATSPARIDRVILCSLPHRYSDRTRATVRTWLEILRTDGLEAMAQAALPAFLGNAFLDAHRRIVSKMVAAMVMRNRPAFLAAHLEALLTYPHPADAAVRLTRPCRVVSGSDDSLVAPDDARQLAVLCRADHVAIAGAGHSVPVEAAEQFNRVLSQFLQAC